MSNGFYRAFEDRYRGERAMIRARLAVYLPLIAPLAREGGATAFDLGCGRGEWLELLGEHGFAAEGADLDDGMLAACRERGLRAVHGDAFDLLKARPDASVAVVSAFHLVEHIPFARVQDLIAEALRVLLPGGVLILETPNPENLVVGTCSFHEDPSHQRPLPPKLLAFAVEFAGFSRQRVMRLQEPKRRDASLTLFDVLDGVSPDYAVVAQKTGTSEQIALLDALFGGRHGVDLHELAQTYQQQLDAVPAQLQLLAQQFATDRQRVNARLAAIDRQVAHLHEASMAIGAEIERQAAAIEQTSSTQAHATAKLETVAQDVGRLAALALQVQAERQARARAEQEAASLRQRVTGLLDMQQAAAGEAGRLAAHVAWIESRLSTAEAAAAAAARTRAGGRSLVRRMVARGRVPPAGPGGAMHILPGRSALPKALVRSVAPVMVRLVVRMTVRLVVPLVRFALRRPALKRAARAALGPFPRVRERLLQLLVAPARGHRNAAPGEDPLAATMSPRSLAIYRALDAAVGDGGR